MTRLTPAALPLVAALALLQSPAAHAQERAAGDAKWGLGLGVSVRKSPYEGVGDKSTVLPLLSYENDWVRLFGTTLDAKLPSAGPVDFSLRAKVALGEGYVASDSAALAGMAARDGSIYLGAATTWHAGFAEFSLDYLHDVSGNSQGARLRLGAEHSFAFAQRFLVTPHASVTRLDAKHVDYFYGVRPEEATAARPAYAGKATAETELGIRFGLLLAPNQRLLLDLVDTHWGSGVTDSPLVGRSSAPGILLGYTYTF